MYIVTFIVLFTAFFANAGTAEQDIEHFYKRCPEPFASEYCFNGGVCFAVSTSYAICICQPGFMGERCNQKYSEDVFRGYITESTTESVNPDIVVTVPEVTIVSIALILVLLVAFGGIIILTHIVRFVINRMITNLSP